jgi:signal transduction histidine kinase/ligand-binding sensor domain-containing protein
VRRASYLTLWRWIFVVVVGLTSCPASALDPSRALAQLKHRRWTMDDGAPYGIQALAQTRDGFLWVGGDTGLFRFDGIRFERMPGLFHHGAPDEAVSALMTARNGELWVGYQSGRIAILRGGRPVDVSPAATEGWVFQLGQDRQGAVWAATATIRQPLSRYWDKRWTAIGPDWGFERRLANSFLIARDGSVWISALGAPLMTLRPGSRQFEDLPFEMRDAGLAQAPDGRIWASDENIGTWMVSQNGKSTATGPSAIIPPTTSELHQRRILFDRDGNLWGATGSGGAFRIRAPEAVLTGGKPREEWFTQADGLSSDRVRAMLEDREGNLWIGTSNGLDRFSNPGIVLETGIPTGSRLGYILLAGRDGSVFAADSDTVYQVRPGGTPERRFTAIDSPQALCEDRQGKLWIGANDGLRHVRAGIAAMVPNPRGSAYLDCVLASDGSVWFSRFRALQRLVGDRWVPGPYSGTATPTVLLAEPDNSILVFLRREGLHRATPTAMTLIWKSSDIPGRDITVLYRMGKQVLIGTQAGLAKLAGGRFTVLRRNYPWLSGISGIVDTPDGMVWLLTKAGIVRLSNAELEKAFANPAHALTPRIFGSEDGMPGPVATAYSKNGAVRGGDGRLWFYTTQGIVTIDPGRLPRNTLAPPVKITALAYRDERLRDPLSVALPAGTSSIQLDYTALSLTVPERVLFKYRLVGTDAGWTNAGSRRQAFYTNLAPGTYRFEVIASNNDGVWNRKGAALDITIPPTFVQSIWFKLLLGLLAVGILVAGYLLRLRHLTRRLQSRFDIRIAERERIARELHDTLLQGFQGLLLQLKAATNRLPKDGDERKPLEDALTHAQSVLVEGRDRVHDLRGAEAGTDLAAALEECASGMILKTKTTVQLTVEGTPRALHPVAHEEMRRIGEEAIRNAVHHSEAKVIEILLRWDRSGVRLAIRDNGVGIPEKILEHGKRHGHFGLIGMRERANRVGAHLTIASQKNGGTEVALALPRHAAYSDQPVRLIDRLFSFSSVFLRRFLGRTSAAKTGQ